MEVEAPRDIARQLLRHRSFTFQEFSQRYAESTDFITRECRLQDHKNRQNSLDMDTDNDDEHNLTSHWWDSAQADVLDRVNEIYKEALEKGIAKEVARVILPEGLTMSKLYVNGTVRSWLHYCDLRDGNGTQREHEDLAKKCKFEVLKHFPFLENVWRE